MPIEAEDIVEGGGLRSFGIANALAETRDFKVTIAVSKNYLKKNTALGPRLDAQQYSDNLQELSELIAKSDVVIYPASAINVSDFVLTQKNLYTKFIADAYVPIHVEVSARQAADLEAEQTSFLENSPRWRKAILEADAILCASQSQKNYYIGFLAGSGNLTPKTYNDHEIILTPFGINHSEINKMVEKKDPSTLRILWYGGFYPWFDSNLFRRTVIELNSLLQANSSSQKLEIVVLGAVNPFVRESSFVSHANSEIESLKKLDFVSFEDWAPYSKRGELISNVDLAISFNPEGPENDMSWRTRYLDFITFCVPLFTNTLDPISKLMVDHGAGFYAENLNPSYLAKSLYKLLEEDKFAESKKMAFNQLQQTLGWKECVSDLSLYIQNSFGVVSIDKGTLVSEKANDPSAKISKISRLSFLIEIFFTIMRREGFRAAIWRVKKFFKSRNIGEVGTQNINIQTINIYTHQLDYSGSPFIALQMGMEFSKKSAPGGDARRVVIHNFGHSNKEILNNLRANGIIVYKYSTESEIGDTPNPDELHVLNGLALPLRVYDVMVLNSPRMINPIKLVIHEDRPSLYLDSNRANKIGMLAKRGKWELISPSKGTARNFDKFIGHTETKNCHYPVSQEVLPSPLDFSAKIRIQMLASTHDSRKNQKQAMLILLAVYNKILLSNCPERWRKLELVLVGVDKKTPYGKEVYELVDLIGSFVEIHEPMPFKEAKEISRTCNAVICVSEYETLPVFVAEGMAMGQIVLRNSCSGLEEQLLEGENGVLIDLRSLDATIGKILLLFDKEQTPDSKLIEMSKKSKAMVTPYIDLSYQEFLGI